MTSRTPTVTFSVDPSAEPDDDDSPSEPYHPPHIALPTHTHTKAMVNPHLRQQLEEFAKHIPLDQWMSSVFQQRYRLLQAWEDQIVEERWFQDDRVQTWLEAFCKAPKEEGRYKPFVDLANYLLQHAQASLPNVSFPVPNTIFLINANRDLEKSRSAKAARRRPDVILTQALPDDADHRGDDGKHQTAASLSDTSDGILYKRQWYEVLQWWEFKRDATRKLLDDLNDERRKAGLAQLTAKSSVR